MGNLGGSYEAGNETMGDRSALPAGDYVAALVKSDKKDAKTPGNAYINCEYEVQDGEHKGRRFWSMLNLWNSNSQAVEIAQRELNSLMHACGKLRVEDTEELHGIPVIVKLKVRSDEKYGDSNDIVVIKPLNSAPASNGAPGGSTGGGKAPPWKQGQAA